VTHVPISLDRAPGVSTDPDTAVGTVGIQVDHDAAGALMREPSGNGIVLRSR
jgi:hypothetical protein